MGLTMNNIDLEDVIENGKILLVNLQPKKNRLSLENARVIGTLLLNEMWEIARQREQGAGGRPPSPFFLMIDEFQLSLHTEDVPGDARPSGEVRPPSVSISPAPFSTGKKIDLDAFGAMSNARIKLVFGGLSREDARILAEEIYPGQVDLKRVKFLIEQTKFWPVYSRDTVYMAGTGRGSASVSSNAEAWNAALEEWVPSSAEAAIESGTEHEGQADIPIFLPVPFKEVSSITTVFARRDALGALGPLDGTVSTALYGPRAWATDVRGRDALR